MKKKILVIGSIGYDLVTFLEKMPQAGETIVGKKFIQNPGGKGDNQAVAASRAGGDTTFMGAIGDDVYGEILKKNLSDNKVKHKLKTVPKMSCQIATILIEPNGENRIVIVPGANNYVDKKQIDDNEKLIDESDIILFQLEIPIETVEYAIDICHKKKKIIILDPAPGRPLPENIVKKVTYLTPNETELSLISGMPSNTMEEIEKASKKIMDMGAQNLIVTLGDKGCLLCQGKNMKVYPTYPTKAIDTTAAGDCFTGVFATYLSKGVDVIEAIKYANLASSISVSRTGAVPSLPSHQEIEDAKKKIKNW
jgi:ribokinase